MTRGSACAWPIVIEGDLLLLNTALKVHVALTDVGFFIRSTDGISGIFVPLIEEAAQSVTVTLSSSRSVCVHTVRPKPTLMARTSVTTRSYIVLTFHFCSTHIKGHRRIVCFTNLTMVTFDPIVTQTFAIILVTICAICTKLITVATGTSWRVVTASLRVQAPVARLTFVTLQTTHPGETVTRLVFGVTGHLPGASLVAVTVQRTSFIVRTCCYGNLVWTTAIDCIRATSVGFFFLTTLPIW